MSIAHNEFALGPFSGHFLLLSFNPLHHLAMGCTILHREVTNKLEKVINLVRLESERNSHQGRIQTNDVAELLTIYSHDLLLFRLHSSHSHEEKEFLKSAGEPLVYGLEDAQSLRCTGKSLRRFQLLVHAKAICEGLLTCNGSQIPPAVGEICSQLVKCLLLVTPVDLREQRQKQQDFYWIISVLVVFSSISTQGTVAWEYLKSKIFTCKIFRLEHFHKIGQLKKLFITQNIEF